MSILRSKHRSPFVLIAVTLVLVAALVSGVSAAVPQERALSTLKISAISPSTGNVGTTISASVSGTGFQKGAQVELRKSGKPTIYATGEAIAGTTRITCKLPISASTATGTWNVVVKSGGKTVVKYNAFTVKKPATTPRIWFTSIPSRSSTTSYVTGKVSGVSPSQYRVTLYIKVRGNWWGPKPYWDSPYTTIAADGSWRTSFITGGVDREATTFAAYLIPASYNPPDIGWASSLPSVLSRFPKVQASR